MSAQLSCSEYSFPAIPSQSDRIGLVRALGFEFVDLALFLEEDGPLVGDPAGVAGVLADGLRTHGLRSPDLFYATGTTFEDIAPNPSAPGLRAERRRGFAAAARVAAELGIKGITILPGISWPRDPGGAWACCVAELGWRVEEGGRLGVEVRVEAHAGSIVALPELAARLFTDVPGLRLTLDLSHFELQSVILERVLPLVPHVGHVHIRAAKPGAIQVRWRDNEIDFPTALSALDSVAYQGALCVEYVPMTKWRCDELDVLTETAATRAWLEEGRKA